MEKEFSGKLSCESGSDLLSTYVKYEIQKSNRRIIKKLLEILEDIKDDRFNVSIDSYAFFRKKILDLINDESRNVEGILEKFQLTLKPNQNESKQD